MKKILLSAFTLGLGLSAMSQGITTKAAFDDFRKASEFADQYSIPRSEFNTFANGACGTLDTAYMGLFTYESKDTDTIKMTVTRNMTDGQLDLEVTQFKGKYEPFGFIFGSYCKDGGEGKFGLDLSANAMLEFTVKVNSLDLKPTMVDGTPSNGTGVQIKVQAEDGKGNSIAFDKSYNGLAKDAWKYEIGITGDVATQTTNNFNNELDHIEAGETVTIKYDLKNGLVANAKGDAPASPAITFDYTDVRAIKITFASNNKDTKSGYDPYEHDGSYSITAFKLGDVVTEGLEEANGLSDKATKLTASVFPNPATSKVNFSEVLENVAIYNAQGTQVFTAASTNNVDVSGFEAGMYFVKSDKGATSFIVK